MSEPTTNSMPLITAAVEEGEKLTVNLHMGGKFHARLGEGSTSRNALGKTIEEALARLERFCASAR